MGKKFDFSGWATKNDLKCSDGRTIRHGAFADQNGQTVPLVWQHQHNDPSNVLGHALLENRDNGVYAYCTFNNTEAGINAKQLVEHGDVTALSIYANQLKQKGGDVLHGVIREVSLVLAGANPGALIDFPILAHGEEAEDEAVIYTGEELVKDEPVAEHAEQEEPAEVSVEEQPKEGEKKMAEEKTVKDVFDELTEEQKKVVYFMIGQALEDAKGEAAQDAFEGEDYMQHNVFEGDEMTSDVLSHAEVEAIFSDAKRFGSLKDAVLAHDAENAVDEEHVPATYGIDYINYLFPDAKAVTNVPEFIKRPDEWVAKVMTGVSHTPFSRIKSVFADITEEDARAKGYFKGNYKKDEVFTLLKRTTTPTTVYKKQKLDRDDVVDITDFDVVAWIKKEMRMMLDEEIARAILVGDGRSGSSDDKILETSIRPIWTDADLYTIKKAVTVAANATDDQKAKAVIRASLKARKDYRGSGSPVLFTTEDMLTNMLLMEDQMGRIIYDSKEKLATAMRVRDIVTSPIMENLTRTDSDSNTRTLVGLIVNLSDYKVGADKGGAVNMFDDFDIDYNQQKYLIETRCSGALVKPYSAIALEMIEESANAGN